MWFVWEHGPQRYPTGVEIPSAFSLGRVALAPPWRSIEPCGDGNRDVQPGATAALVLSSDQQLSKR